MPSISFRVFKSKIQDGSKRQTIRPPRKHPVKVGDSLYLWWKQRTKDREFLGESTCLETSEIQLLFNNREITVGGNALTDLEKEILARADGFDSLDDFFEYFAKESDGCEFSGNLILWDAEPIKKHSASLP